MQLLSISPRSLSSAQAPARYSNKQQQQQQSFISCPEKFSVDKYMQRDKLTMKKMSTAT